MRELALLLALAAICNAKDLPSFATRETSLGKITGIKSTINGQTYFKYLGVPYGKAGRFEKPQPFGSFTNDPQDATKFGPRCPQVFDGKVLGSEDCLHLNIYVPKCQDATKKWSVMIWIFGGVFAFGGPDAYPGDVLTAHNDVIVVTINYRLNLLGFLSSGSDSLPGNYGLWDQQLAIQWVKNNIADYGGDADSITLFGQSAGAMSITFHMVSPSTPEGLFHRAITQSGSAFAIRFLSLNIHAPVYQAITSAFGCDLFPDPVACLKSLPLNILMQASPGILYYPAIDDEFVSSSFVSQLALFTSDNVSPLPNIGLNKFLDYDIMSGWNTLEGMYLNYALEGINLNLTGKNLSEGVSEQVLQIAIASLTGASTPEAFQLVGLMINFYMNNPRPIISDGRSIKDRRVEVFSELIGDFALTMGAITHLQIHSKMSGKHTYAYEFRPKRGSERGLYGVTNPDWLRAKATHGDEVAFVFGAPVSPPQLCLDFYFITPQCLEGSYTDAEKDLSESMMEIWTDFAKDGDLGDDVKEFMFRGQQNYQVLDINSEGEHGVYPRKSEHRYAQSLDQLAVNSASSG